MGGEDDAIRRAAESVRRSAVAVVNTTAGPSRLAEIAARIDSLADELEKTAQPAVDRIAEMDTRGRVVRYSPVVGTHNAVAPPLRLIVAEGGLEGTVTFSVMHEIRPGVVHGGIAAMVLDVALADVNVRAGRPGLTAELTLRFHRQIPTGRELTVTSWHGGSEGRKAYSHAEIRLAGELCVSADGLFITARPAVARDG